MSVTACTITENDVYVTLAVSTTGLKAVVITVIGFTNPYSTSPIEGNVAVLTSAAGVVKETYSGATMTNFSPAVMASATITPTNFVVGAKGTTIRIDMKLTNLLKTNGQIQI